MLLYAREARGGLYLSRARALCRRFVGAPRFIISRSWSRKIIQLCVAPAQPISWLVWCYMQIICVLSCCLDTCYMLFDRLVLVRIDAQTGNRVRIVRIISWLRSLSAFRAAQSSENNLIYILTGIYILSGMRARRQSNTTCERVSTYICNAVGHDRLCIWVDG